MRYRCAMLYQLLFVFLAFMLLQRHVMSTENSLPDHLSVEVCDVHAKQWCIGAGKAKGTVIVVISTNCPIANSYQPELQRLKKELDESGLQFLMVHADPELSSEQAEEHARQYDIQWGVVLDPSQELLRKLQAAVIPSAFLLNSKGQIVYSGRIDDRHTALGRKKPAASRQDLRLAIQQYLAGEPIEVPATQGVGCRVKYRIVN